MKKVITVALLATLGLSSCVSKKAFTELEDKYAALKQEKREVDEKNSACEAHKKTIEQELASVTNLLNQIKGDKANLARDIAALENKRSELKNSYQKLKKNSTNVIAETSAKNKQLEKELAEKEAALKQESDRLITLQEELEMRAKKADELQKSLVERSNRVTELEAALAAKEQHMKKLKNSISKALTNFEGKGLTVERRNGKVYVSMENKLLFQSGSWTIGTEGIKAVSQLGEVLAANPDIKVLIEGHTDNDALSGKGDIANNWDLSTKRATSIVAILQQNKKINPHSLTAAGRSEYAPIGSNDTAEGKAKNRRIEVILTPKLDEVSRILSDVN